MEGEIANNPNDQLTTSSVKISAQLMGLIDSIQGDSTRGCRKDTNIRAEELQSLPNRAYLERSVIPLLVDALGAIARER